MEPMLDAPAAVELGTDTPPDAPKTTTGKFLKRALRDELAKG